MPGRVSGKRYAQAIFELALEQDQLEQWAVDLELASQVLQDPEFSAFLKHAEVAPGDKIKSIDAVLRDIHPLVRNLVYVLVTKGLVDLGPEVNQAYTALSDLHLGRQRVEVTSAVSLDDTELDRITRFVSGLTGKEVVVSTQVDEDIMGGIVIQIGDQLLDGSTRSRLELLRDRMRSGIVTSSA